MRCRLVDRQSNFVESRNLHNSTTSIAMHIVVCKIRHNLPQSDNISITSSILCEIVPEDGDLLVRRGLSSLTVQCRTIPVVRKEIMMNPCSHRCGRATRISSNKQTTLIVLHQVILWNAKKNDLSLC